MCTEIKYVLKSHSPGGIPGDGGQGLHHGPHVSDHGAHVSLDRVVPEQS